LTAELLTFAYTRDRPSPAIQLDARKQPLDLLQ